VDVGPTDALTFFEYHDSKLWQSSPSLECAGTGGNPGLGEQAAEESSTDLQTAVGNADMVIAPSSSFLTPTELLKKLHSQLVSHVKPFYRNRAD